jgi:hypothetical protein
MDNSHGHQSTAPNTKLCLSCRSWIKPESWYRCLLDENHLSNSGTFFSVHEGCLGNDLQSGSTSYIDGRKFPDNSLHAGDFQGVRPKGLNETISCSQCDKPITDKIVAMKYVDDDHNLTEPWHIKCRDPAAGLHTLQTGDGQGETSGYGGLKRDSSESSLAAVTADQFRGVRPSTSVSCVSCGHCHESITDRIQAVRFVGNGDTEAWHLSCRNEQTGLNRSPDAAEDDTPQLDY